MTSLRILVLGAGGQLAADLMPTLQRAGHIVTPAVRDEVDVTQSESLASAIDRHRPTLVVNCAAYNNVDQAEVEREACRRINADAPALLGRLAAECDASVLHFSTDFVFDGRKLTPYTEDDEPNPLSWYGRCKLEGEGGLLASGADCLVLRVSWLYRHTHSNFFTKLMSLGATRPTLRVVDDQVGCPGYTADVADAVAAAVDAMARARHAAAQIRGARLYHLATPDWCSRHEFARAIFDAAPAGTLARPVAIEPCSSAEFPTPAVRPRNSRLDASRFRHDFGVSLPSWRQGLQRCVRALAEGQP